MEGQTNRRGDVVFVKTATTLFPPHSFSHSFTNTFHLQGPHQHVLTEQIHHSLSPPHLLALALSVSSSSASSSSHDSQSTAVTFQLINPCTRIYISTQAAVVVVVSVLTEFFLRRSLHWLESSAQSNVSHLALSTSASRGEPS